MEGIYHLPQSDSTHALHCYQGRMAKSNDTWWHAKDVKFPAESHGGAAVMPGKQRQTNTEITQMYHDNTVQSSISNIIALTWIAVAEFRGIFANFISNTITCPQSHFTPETYRWPVRGRIGRQRRSHSSIWVRILHRPAYSRRHWVRRRRCVRRRHAAKPAWGRI
jgi:hypothetical protein